MADYTRPKARTGNPNLALVILLVLFVLTTIGFGLWGYYGYEGQEELKVAAKKKSEEAAAALNSKDYWALIAMEMKLIDGQELNPDEKLIWTASRQELLNPKGKFGKEKYRQEYLDLFEEYEKTLGFDEDAGKYKETWKNKIKPMEAKIAELTGNLGRKDGIIAELEKDKLALNKQVKDFGQKLQKQNDDSEKALTKAKTEQTDYMKEQSKRNSDLVVTLQAEKETGAEREQQWFKLKDTMDREILNLTLNIKDAKEKGSGAQNSNTVRVGEQPLLLDVSMGKPLWDTPVGTILAVVGDTVLIQVEGDGLEERLKTKLTFNVFASGKDNKADRTMKGTIEVISLEGGRTAKARITSRFGDDSNKMAEGDLLFNFVWGTHVAIAGKVNLFSKFRGESPLEQVGNLKNFIAKLEDQGVIVDAYVDLTDGSIKGKYGAITPKTQFLIKGREMDEKKDLAPAPAPAEAPEDKEKGADLAKLAEGRVMAINESIKMLRGQAFERGLFIISPENFANVAGYRKLGGYGPEDVTPFQPTLPAANGR